MKACSVRVYGDSFTGHMCSRNAKVEREGKWYCGIHDPEYVAKKNAERQAKWDAEWESKKEGWQRADGIKALGEWVLSHLAGQSETLSIAQAIEIAKKHGLLP